MSKLDALTVEVPWNKLTGLPVLTPAGFFVGPRSKRPLSSLLGYRAFGTGIADRIERFRDRDAGRLR
jgi:hypothetical protein